jgi:hypothetical protein
LRKRRWNWRCRQWGKSTCIGGSGGAIIAGILHLRSNGMGRENEQGGESRNEKRTPYRRTTHDCLPWGSGYGYLISPKLSETLIKIYAKASGSNYYSKFLY